MGFFEHIGRSSITVDSHQGLFQHGAGLSLVWHEAALNDVSYHGLADQFGHGVCGRGVEWLCLCDAGCLYFSPQSITKKSSEAPFLEDGDRTCTWNMMKPETEFKCDVRSIIDFVCLITL